MMNVEHRLAAVQATLTERGYKDVKFYLGAISETPASKVAADAADVLEAVVSGKVRYVTGLGDSKKAAVSATI